MSLKDIDILAIILVSLIMTLQGSYWTDQKDNHNEVIMTSIHGAIKWSHEGIG